MTIAFSNAVREARANQLESITSTTAKLLIYSGAIPTTTATAASGTMLCRITLPSDWMGAASTSTNTTTVAKLGTWSGTGDAAASTGTNAGYFRILNNAESTCHMQGTITGTGGGGDMTLDNVSIASGQAVTVNGFTLTEANATS